MAVSNEHFVAEALRLVADAEAKGLRLRILGSLAYRLHCPENLELFDKMERDLTDIDFAVEKSQIKDIRDFLVGEGYVEDQKITMATEGSRYYLEHPDTGLGVDLFVDELYFCHRIPFEGRLDLDAPTIPTVDLLLEKMQIVEINLKDIKDTLVLLLEHDLHPQRNGRETIDLGYMLGLLRDDWGFFYTVTQNLEKTKRFLPQFDTLAEPQKQLIARRIDELLAAIADEPKSRKWKLRAKVGTKKRWYQEVGAKDSGF
jgi:hypothetical protein